MQVSVDVLLKSYDRDFPLGRSHWKIYIFI